MKAKIVAGLLPPVNHVVAHQARFTPGVCVGCDTTVGGSQIAVFFDTAGGRHLLHVDCYVMWAEACSA